MGNCSDPVTQSSARLGPALAVTDGCFHVLEIQQWSTASCSLLLLREGQPDMQPLTSPLATQSNLTWHLTPSIPWRREATCHHTLFLKLEPGCHRCSSGQVFVYGCCVYYLSPSVLAALKKYHRLWLMNNRRWILRVPEVSMPAPWGESPLPGAGCSLYLPK